MHVFIVEIDIPRILQKQVHLSETKTNTTVRTTEESTLKIFIYLTQTEQCLPAKLSSSRAIGDSKTCNCDVIVLSYRKECREDKPPHISHILFRESTWTSGRNILYFVARERKPGYHYYIFLDDDLDLEFNLYAPQEMKILTPFRAFEQWLLEYEPAVGALANSLCAEKVLERRRTLCGINETSMVVPTVWMDAMFNAFHHKAIEYILPYPTQYDKLSWWTSQFHVICSAELLFRGQALLCVPLTVFNRKHRPYPRTSAKTVSTQVAAIVKEIQNRAPVVYQNRTLFKKLKNRLFILKYIKETLTYCMNTTRRHPIVPYLHFERESPKK